MGMMVSNKNTFEYHILETLFSHMTNLINNRKHLNNFGMGPLNDHFSQGQIGESGS